MFRGLHLRTLVVTGTTAARLPAATQLLTVCAKSDHSEDQCIPVARDRIDSLPSLPPGRDRRDNRHNPCYATEHWHPAAPPMHSHPLLRLLSHHLTIHRIMSEKITSLDLYSLYLIIPLYWCSPPMLPPRVRRSCSAICTCLFFGGSPGMSVMPGGLPCHL